MRMILRLCRGGGLAALACSAVAWAQGADRLKSPECRTALESLTAQEEAAASAPAAGARSEGPTTAALARRLEPYRLAAAKACLGGLPSTPPPSRHLAQPAITVPSAGATPRVTPPAPVPPPRAVTPTLTLTACDAAGCWASDGTRLTRQGIDLVGPRGLCRQQGTLLSCP